MLDDQRILAVIEDVLEELHDGICITDGDGIILRTGKSCETLYGIKDNYEGRHVSVLEEEGAFSPCLTLLALKERRKITMMQPDRFGHQLLVTATPIFDPHSGEILYVISYASWDSTNLSELQTHYNQLQKEIVMSNMQLSSYRKELLSVELVCHSAKMKNLQQFADKVAPLEVDLLVTGESGSGKAHFAKYMHKISHRQDQPFCQMSCSAFSGEILEDELFGYSRTNPQSGEETEKIGLCEVADSGTLLLEDVEHLSWEAQGILLYLLKNKSYFKRGSKQARQADIRLIATSRKDVTALQSILRKEFFYALSVAHTAIPSLKERKEDIPYFVAIFLEQYNRKYRKDMRMSDSAAELLQLYHWPGNITELKYVIQQVVLIVEEDRIQPYHLPDTISPFSASHFSANIDLKEYLEYYEGRLVLQAYEKCKTTVKLAKYLGISQPSAVRKLQKYSGSQQGIQK